MFRVRGFAESDRPEWFRMRRALWSDSQERELDELLQSDSEQVFFAERDGGGLCGFLEAAIRPWASGCQSQPVGYIEGWYVDPDMRRQGIGGRLVKAAEDWARSRGCREMASDAELPNTTSQQAHRALGYEETLRLVLYRKPLSSQNAPE